MSRKTYKKRNDLNIINNHLKIWSAIDIIFCAISSI